MLPLGGAAESPQMDSPIKRLGIITEIYRYDNAKQIQILEPQTRTTTKRGILSYGVMFTL